MRLFGSLAVLINKKMIQQEEIKNSILNELGLSSLPDNYKDEFLSRLGEGLIKRITAAVLEKLPERLRGEFEALSKAGDNDKMHQFLKDSIPNIDEITQRELKEGIEEFKNIADGLR